MFPLLSNFPSQFYLGPVKLKAAHLIPCWTGFSHLRCCRSTFLKYNGYKVSWTEYRMNWGALKNYVRKTAGTAAAASRAWTCRTTPARYPSAGHRSDQGPQPFLKCLSESTSRSWYYTLLTGMTAPSYTKLRLLVKTRTQWGLNLYQDSLSRRRLFYSCLSHLGSVRSVLFSTLSLTWLLVHVTLGHVSQ